MWQIVVSGINKVRSDRMINGRDRRYFRREDRQIARKKKLKADVIKLAD